MMQRPRLLLGSIPVFDNPPPQPKPKPEQQPEYLPTPEDIKRETARIREGWTEEDYRRRADAILEPTWDPPFIHVDELGLPDDEEEAPAI
jgi:hypothetical protein